MGMGRIAWGLGASLAICAVAQAGPGRWSLAGPAGGNVVAVVVDSSNPDRAIAAGRGGIYRTQDAGDHWQRHEDGLVFSYAQWLRREPTTGVAYVVPNGRELYRGTAAGPWVPTALDLAATDWIRDIAVRHDAGGHLLVATGSGLLRSSSDGGVSMATLAGAGIPADGALVRIEYASATRVYGVLLDETYVLPARVLRSDDAGASWSATAPWPGGGMGWTALLAATPGVPDRVYAAVREELAVSSNGGAAWALCAPLPGADMALTLAPVPGEADRLWVGGTRGLYLSSDGCASWSTRGAGISADGMRPDAISSIALAPGYPAIARLWVGSNNGGLYRSSDDGLSFVPASEGFASHNIRALVAHPAQAGHLWAGHGDATDPSGTVWRSTDGAASWQRSNTGLGALHLRGLAVDPTTAAFPGGPHLYGVGSSLWNGMSPSAYALDGGIYKSTNGGASWSTIDAGLPATYMGTRYIGTVRSAVLDPRSCAFPPVSGPCSTGPLQTVYVTASGRPDMGAGTYAAARIYKSVDAGATWSASETGLPPPQPGSCGHSQIAVPLVIDPADPQTLYLGLSLNWTRDGSCPVPSVANGIFKSSDGGATWVHASNGIPRLGGPGSSNWSSLALALAPSQPHTLYASAYEYDVDGAMRSRVFRSTDAGANWTERSVGVAGQDVRALLVDPLDADIVYAAAAGSGVNGGGVYRSTDGGATWNSFSLGLEGTSVTTLVFDPFEPGRIHAGTSRGVAEYTFVPDDDSDGVPGAVEDAAPHGGDGNQDGVPDSAQPQVASLPGIAAPGGRGNQWVTLWVEQVREGSCARINNMQVVDAVTLPLDQARGPVPTAYADGVLRFDLPDCQRARLHARFHGADHTPAGFGWRNYGPELPGVDASVRWYDFAAATRIAPDTWALELDSSAQGNYRDDPEVISFVGGVGFLDLHLFGSGFEAESDPTR